MQYTYEADSKEYTIYDTNGHSQSGAEASSTEIGLVVTNRYVLKSTVPPPASIIITFDPSWGMIRIDTFDT